MADPRPTLKRLVTRLGRIAEEPSAHARSVMYAAFERDAAAYVQRHGAALLEALDEGATP